MKWGCLGKRVFYHHSISSLSRALLVSYHQSYPQVAVSLVRHPERSEGSPSVGIEPIRGDPSASLGMTFVVFYNLGRKRLGESHE
jgi:hypothetical protein